MTCSVVFGSAYDSYAAIHYEMFETLFCFCTNFRCVIAGVVEEVTSRKKRSLPREDGETMFVAQMTVFDKNR